MSSVTTRLRKLEEIAQKQAAAEAEEAAELNRWETNCTRWAGWHAASVMLDGIFVEPEADDFSHYIRSAYPEVNDWVTRRWSTARFDAIHPDPKRFNRELRWPISLYRLLSLLRPDQRGPAVQTLADRRSWLEEFTRRLAFCWARLPPDVAPELVQDVADQLLTGPDKGPSWSCAGCGMIAKHCGGRPERCLHCLADFVWTSSDRHYGWMQLAADELDTLRCPALFDGREME